jgi:flagellin
MRINQNIMAFNAYRNLTITQRQLGSSLEKLSSGFRINRAADDAAGLVISQALRSQVSGLRVASRNAQDGISVVQTAEGALNEVHSMLNRMRDLAVQAANTGSNDATATAAAQAEIDALASEITRISQQTKFGASTLLDGAFTKQFQVGSNAGEVLTVSLGTSLNASALGVSALSVGTAGVASSAIAAIDTAIATVSSTRASLGAFQNRFNSVINNTQVATENLAAAESRIRDTDMALEMVSFTRHQILMQAGTAMLGQANQSPQSVLRLIQ